ncbi:uncharacterized protein LOC125502691 isoform X2 [Dendroctonus ponderosae]|uniref:uncharacterized protein LOC125502691 isoform X2 n=1 Tax=Dendroctonus ponderosae TaxID=77166 RepID=UPI00203618D1|nr:uncharacterized protein LOC125502691 isoform X2 [Dendroctonus ponderosae]
MKLDIKKGSIKILDLGLEVNELNTLFKSWIQDFSTYLSLKRMKIVCEINLSVNVIICKRNRKRQVQNKFTTKYDYYYRKRNGEEIVNDNGNRLITAKTQMKTMIALHQTAKAALGLVEEKSRRRKPYWWNAEIEREIEEKRKRYHIYLSQKTENAIQNYKSAQTKVHYLTVWISNSTNIPT